MTDPSASEAMSADLPAARREIARLNTALAAAAERERILAHELQHRIRNMLSVVRSIHRRSRESGDSQEEFAEHLIGRLDAVARYYAHVDAAGSAGIELEDMLRAELLEARCLDGPNCAIDGPPVFLRQKSAELMGLALHELATNSVKFGALAQDGQLAVAWSVDEQAAEPRLHFSWTETGFSPLAPAPRRAGFGRQLIEEALPYQLGAATSFQIRPGGLACIITLPLPPEQGALADHDDQPLESAPLLPTDAG